MRSFVKGFNHGLLDHLSADKPKEDIAPILKNASSHLSRAERLGHILDIISRAISSGEGEKLFLRKPVWRSTQIYNIMSILARTEAMVNNVASIARDCHPIELRPKPSDVVTSAFVDLWIDNGKCRPSDLFYDELLSEIMVNASHNGKCVAKKPVAVEWGVEVVHSADDENTQKALVFRNTSAEMIDVAKLNLSRDRWKKWDTAESGAVGGLFFLAMCLEKTGAGCLVAAVEKSAEGDDVFCVGLCLKGLDDSATTK